MIYSRPRTMKELCALYGLSAKTLRRQMRIAGIGRPAAGGYYYTIRQLQDLAEALGEPNSEEK